MCETTQFKTCSKCGEEKPLLAFRPKETGRFGVRADCNDCQNALNRERRRATGHAISDEAREAKRARDRERQKRTQGRPERLAAHAKYRNTEKYRLLLEKQRDQRLAKKEGFHTAIIIRACACCGKIEAKREQKVSRLTIAYCGKCARKNAFTGLRHTATSRPCIDCCSTFMGVAGAKRCPTCADAAYKRLRDAKLHKIKKRALYYGCKIETVNRYVVYNRDRYKCYICGCSVVRSATYRPDQATIDHVVPLSKGGPHTYDNVRTACMSCNTRKSNKIVSALHLREDVKGRGMTNR